MSRGRQRQGDFIGRGAEWIANKMGSAAFLLGMTVFIITWFVTNAIREFDPQFFVLNLLFSTMSSYAAPLIMLAQNRVAARDHAMIENDREMNRQARTDMEYLTGQITLLRTSLDDLPTRSAFREDSSALITEAKALVLLGRLRGR